MPARYFASFANTTYDGYPVKNILSRTKVIDRKFNNPYLYYPYDIQNDQRADTVARLYYGDPFFSWLIYEANQIIDPFYGWVLPQPVLLDSITDKYGSLEYAQAKVICYRVNWEDDARVLSVSGYDALPDDAKKYWEPTYKQNRIIGYTRVQWDWITTTNQFINVVSGNNALFVVGDTVQFTLLGDVVGSAEVATTNSSVMTLQHVQGETRPLFLFDAVPQSLGSYLEVTESVQVSNGTANVTAFAQAVTSNNITLAMNNAPPTGNLTFTGALSGAVMTCNGAVLATSVMIAPYTSNTATTNLSQTLKAYVIPEVEAAYWAPHYAYDEEDEQNAAKRSIRLIDKNYASQAYVELRKLMAIVK